MVGHRVVGRYDQINALVLLVTYHRTLNFEGEKQGGLQTWPGLNPCLVCKP